MAPHLGNPHDALFRFVFADLQHAEDLLRRLLPASMRRPLARCRITALPASTSGPNLGPHHADLLFAVRHPGLGQPILLLLEHKSGRDHRLTRQLLRYVTNFGPALASRRGLPPFFVPLVVHHGRRAIGELRWRPPPRKAAPTGELFAALRGYDPTVAIEAWDLTTCTQTELAAAPLTALARLCLLFLQFVPGIDEPACIDNVQRWAPMLREAAAAPGGHLGIQRLHSYVLHVTSVSPARLAAAFAKILHPSFESTMITTAQRLHAQGKAEGKAELLMRLLSARFGPVPTTIAERIRAATADELDSFGLRLLNAASLDDVFRAE